MEFEKIERQKNSNQDTDQVSISKRKNVTSSMLGMTCYFIVFILLVCLYLYFCSPESRGLWVCHEYSLVQSTSNHFHTAEPAESEWAPNPTWPTLIWSGKDANLPLMHQKLGGFGSNLINLHLFHSLHFRPDFPCWSWILTRVCHTSCGSTLKESAFFYIKHMNLRVSQELVWECKYIKRSIQLLDLPCHLEMPHPKVAQSTNSPVLSA